MADVSRPVLRQALHRLRDEGLLRIVRGRRAEILRPARRHLPTSYRVDGLRFARRVCGLLRNPGGSPGRVLLPSVFDEGDTLAPPPENPARAAWRQLDKTFSQIPGLGQGSRNSV